LLVKKADQEEEAGSRTAPDEIPPDVHKKLNLPADMGMYEINFAALRRADISMKKQTPFWSGQDVFPDQMDFQKSTWVVTQLNLIRVWPQGVKGVIKRIRYVLRIIVKHALFDALMTFMVVLNTVTLASEHYDMDVDLKA
jgi:hypothetical protein